MVVNEEEFSKIKGELRDKIDDLIYNAEERIETNGKIIRLRKFLIWHILESYSGWMENGDSIPEYVKVGAYIDDWIEIIYHK